jgi:hypothetical protein
MSFVSALAHHKGHLPPETCRKLRILSDFSKWFQAQAALRVASAKTHRRRLLPLRMHMIICYHVYTYRHQRRATECGNHDSRQMCDIASNRGAEGPLMIRRFRRNYSPHHFWRKARLTARLQRDCPNYSPAPQVSSPNGDLIRAIPNTGQVAKHAAPKTCNKLFERRGRELFATGLSNPANYSDASEALP